MGRPGEVKRGAEEQGSAKEALYAGVSIVLFASLLSLRDVV